MRIHNAVYWGMTSCALVGGHHRTDYPSSGHREDTGNTILWHSGTIKSITNCHSPDYQALICTILLM
jgi:hypothetical protein